MSKAHNLETGLAVLGGGIAGISAGYFARKQGIQSVVYESATRPGGLVDHFYVSGFRFDNAIHLSFATENEVREIFDRVPYTAHPSVSWCWDKEMWLKHPAQNNMFPLSTGEKVELIAGLLERPKLDPKDYRDWLIYQYGVAIAERWPLGYTKKYWTLPAEELGLTWIGNRVRRVDVREVLYGAFTADTPSYYYANEMRYPLKGGFRAFIDSMIAETDILCNYKAVEVKPEERMVMFSNGNVCQYQSLVSTLPLPSLIKLIPSAPSHVKQAAEMLVATSVDLISVGFSKANIQPHLWFYIYDDDIYASRAHSPSIKSADNVPEGCSSLQFEIYSSSYKPLSQSVDEMKSNTLMALKRMGIVASDSDVMFMHHKHIPYANVIFDHGMEERRQIVREWLKSNGLIAAGRFGEWDYLWSNQAMMSGKKAALDACANLG